MRTTIFAMMLVLGWVSSGSVEGALVFFDTPDPVVAPGETIPVSIFTDEPSGAIRMDRIRAIGGGTAGNLFLNPDYIAPSFVGTIINTSGILIEDVRGGINVISPFVTGVLYSFDYTVPLGALHNQVITIFADSSGDAVNWVDIVGMIEDVPVESLSLTVFVPEPISLLFLGIGRLALLRQRTKHRTSC